ncbi:MAG TPA: DUF393 domain-containing protein [Porticoccus sp.]|nr:DUF393 domain-containing protein [Porticoccus sp.]
MIEHRSGKLTVYYDGACPSCVRDRRNYERLAGENSNVYWLDITGREDELRALGIDPKKALTELHVSDERKNIISEVDAYRVLMNRVPRLKPLAWLIGLPIIRPIVSRVYHWQVNRRLRREGRL